MIPASLGSKATELTWVLLSPRNEPMTSQFAPRSRLRQAPPRSVPAMIVPVGPAPVAVNAPPAPGLTLTQVAGPAVAGVVVAGAPAASGWRASPSRHTAPATRDARLRRVSKSSLGGTRCAPSGIRPRLSGGHTVGLGRG